MAGMHPVATHMGFEGDGPGHAGSVSHMLPHFDAWLCVMQPCDLYLNQKAPTQHLFTAAAALYSLTGSPRYRNEADSWWPSPETFPELEMYLYNWNNVLAQVRRHTPTTAVRAVVSWDCPPLCCLVSNECGTKLCMPCGQMSVCC